MAGLRGHNVVIDFISTRCTDACPIANAAFIQLQERLRAGGSGALLLTVTLDPAYDRPFVMAREA
ncbi:MAG: SCO family protein, partial [bacterium]|nr:SCO family protein [bacterium]